MGLADLFTLLHIVLVLIAVVIVVWWWRRGVLPKSGDLPRCAKCGYAVVGRTEPRCPECGEDVRVCGVVPPHQRNRLWLGWAIVWTVVAITATNVVGGHIPELSIPGSEVRFWQSMVISHRVGSPIETTLELKAHGKAQVALRDLRAQKISWQLGRARLRLDVTTSQGHLESPGGTGAPRALDRVLMEEFVEAGGVPRNHAIFNDMVEDVLKLSPRLIHMPLQDFEKTRHSVRHSWSSSTSSTTIGHDIVYFYPAVVTGVVLWMLGMRRILRLRPQPLRGDDAAVYLAEDQGR